MLFCCYVCCHVWFVLRASCVFMCLRVSFAGCVILFVLLCVCLLLMHVLDCMFVVFGCVFYVHVLFI